MSIFLQKLSQSFVVRAYISIAYYLNTYGFHLLLLLIRIWMARIFWYSGLTKISDWQSTIFLFKYEYKIPLIYPEIAAILATIAELTLPVLLTIGIMSRLSALFLIFMTAVIQFTYLDFIEHFYWAILLAVIMLHGPGKYSMDQLICDRLN